MRQFRRHSLAGTQIWYVPPAPEKREAAMASREAMGGYLSERAWMAPVLDETFKSVNRLADWGYPFPRNEEGEQQRISVQGPEYMRLMRRRVKNAGVTILDFPHPDPAQHYRLVLSGLDEIAILREPVDPGIYMEAAA
ncbi:hypothetical protein [Rhizobium mesoamericanum]|uniref:hypothetical protein n=1 Tax=Rhizobium mesoamericanum TaxID=1079800 RepID=UPI000427BFAE|nr:hypothetical protein [Rhizobium mesoamericanum]